MHGSSIRPKMAPLRDGIFRKALHKATLTTEDPRIGNFHRVEHISTARGGKVYRGAAPNNQAAFIAMDKEYGISDNIDLRGPHSTAPEHFEYQRHNDEINGITYHNYECKHEFAMKSKVPPTINIVDSANDVLDTAEGNVFINCKQGVHRTGGVIGSLEISRGGLSGEEASKCMRNQGGYKGIYRHIAPAQGEFVRNPPEWLTQS